MRVRIITVYAINKEKCIFLDLEIRWELGESKNTKMKVFRWVFRKNKKFLKNINFWLKNNDFADIFSRGKNLKIWKSQKNHDFSKNRSKIEFWCSYRSKSSSFWKYSSRRSFWYIYHSYTSFFHLVWIIWRRPPHASKMVKIQAEFHRKCRMFNKFSREIEVVWQQSVFAIL